MQYFDLNIPYLESDKKTRRDIRLKSMARAVELGYSGIAFNRTIKGAMSQSDGCTIPRFPLSSLLKLHVSLSSTASFHRRLLRVPESVTFRQFTRLTVVVESDAQSSALNSGNPVLKTYDLVAVTPLNQSCFDHACQSAQVDMISIDFGKRLPFRLKLSSVKAAIERGVYFEIMYSSFLEDDQVRRQLISNAKLLVEWTRGKNVVVSSAAPSFHEIRGPNDVSNLLHLLGLLNEKAKAAISKNCRLLIANALKKKQFYKEAIRVEMMPASVRTDSKEPWIIDDLNWDPLSSGEGDLCLEDLAKSFAESENVRQPVKSIDFTSLIDNGPSLVKQGGGTGFRIESTFSLSTNVTEVVSSSMDIDMPKETLKQRQQESTSLPSSFPSLKGNIDEISEQAVPFSLTNHAKDVECIISHEAILEQFTIPDTLEVTPPLVKLDEKSPHDNRAVEAEDMVVDDEIKETTSVDAGSNIESVSISREEVPVGSDNFDHNGVQADTRLGLGAFNKIPTGDSLEVQLCAESNSVHSSDLCLKNHLFQVKPDLLVEADSAQCDDKTADMGSFSEENNAGSLASLDVQHLQELANVPERRDVDADEMMNVDSSSDRNKSDGLMLENSLRVEDVTTEHGQNEEHPSEVKTDKEESQLSNTMMRVNSLYEENNVGSSLIAKSLLTKEGIIETGKQVQELVKAEHHSLGERTSGNHKMKRSALGPVLRFPFKRLLQQRPFKKGRTPMYKTKKRCLKYNNYPSALEVSRQLRAEGVKCNKRLFLHEPDEICVK